MYNNIIRIVINIGRKMVRVGETIPNDIDKDAIKIIQSVQAFTMTSSERLFALIQAVRYVVKAEIPGSIVECGVWKGGSMMAAILALIKMNSHEKSIYLFDTYEGMVRPTEFDVNHIGQNATDIYDHVERRNGASWFNAPIEDVKRNINSTGYEKEKLNFIKGKIENTIPDSAPAEISILRLDTDWYESTRHELIHLYPRLSYGGVLIIDDYGHWLGSKKAVDEYFKDRNIEILLNRIDYTGRIAIKII